MTAYDVFVVGSGPAGATAAKALGEAGISTLVLDKSTFPRDKPAAAAACGFSLAFRI